MAKARSEKEVLQAAAKAGAKAVDKVRKSKSPRDPSLRYVIGTVNGDGKLEKSLHDEQTIGRAFRMLPTVAKIAGLDIEEVGVFRLKRVSAPAIK